LSKADHKRTWKDHQLVDEPVDEQHIFLAKTFIVQAAAERQTRRVKTLQIILSVRRCELSPYGERRLVAPELRRVEFAFVGHIQVFLDGEEFWFELDGKRARRTINRSIRP